jgi:hypothetical protein
MPGLSRVTLQQIEQQQQLVIRFHRSFGSLGTICSVI